MFVPITAGPSGNRVVDQFYLSKLISDHNTWLETRQTIIAQNIANADAPGFRAKGVVPFQEFMATTKMAVSITHERHMSPVVTDRAASYSHRDGVGEAIKHSGNTVKLEHELVKASEVSRAFKLNANISRAFHSMLSMSVRG